MTPGKARSECVIPSFGTTPLAKYLIVPEWLIGSYLLMFGGGSGLPTGIYLNGKIGNLGPISLTTS